MNAEVGPARLSELEAVIGAGLGTFYEVGHALMEIREARLYRHAGYTRFEDYTRERWDMQHSQANRLMEGARTVDALCTSPMGEVHLVNERQARELAPLARRDPQAAVRVLVAVVAQTAGKVTAAAIARAVRQYEHEHVIRRADCEDQQPTSPYDPAAEAEAKRQADRQELRALIARLDAWPTIGQVYRLCDTAEDRLLLRETARALRDMAYRIETDLDGWTADPERRRVFEARIDEEIMAVLTGEATIG